MQNNSPKSNNFYSDDETRRQLMQRRAAKEKRRRMLRRNRIIFTSTIILLLILAAVALFRVIAKGKKPSESMPITGSASAVVSSAPPVLSALPTSSAAQSAAAAPASSLPVASAPAVAVSEAEWSLLLTNANNPLPEGFTPEVVKVDAAGHEFDKRAAGALTDMIKAGNDTGLKLMICSAYRSTARQTELFNSMKADYIKGGMKEDEAYAKTKTIRAIPGTSEHETGLAADIVSQEHQVLEDSFDTTKEYAWLIENAHKYGFILRYPREKNAITGIIYEPWHYRYVGKEAAKAIKDKGICLEEYIDEVIR